VGVANVLAFLGETQAEFEMSRDLGRVPVGVAQHCLAVQLGGR